MNWKLRAVRVVVSSTFLALPASLFAQAGFDGANLAMVTAHRTAATAATVPTAAGSGSSILSIGFASFRPASSAVTYDQDSDSHWFQTSGPTVPWTARVSLPTGAVVDSIDLDACVSSLTGGIGFFMTRSLAGGRDETRVINLQGAFHGASECELVSNTPSDPPLVIDNAAFNYWLVIVWVTDFSSANEVAGMRVHYHLQVSPDPAVATFTDVPVGHPQHRFVEALVAAGVTAGCGGGLYCPDNPVTRGQMAVFLSVALGLNWPN